MVCPQCGSRKARRACPALGVHICAICCGTKRQVEIACPEDCGYLASARAHPAAQVQRRRELETVFVARRVRNLTERQHQLFIAIMFAIERHARRAVPQLLDEDVASAAGAAAATLETATKGILYEHRPQSLPAQRLMDALKTDLLELQKHERWIKDADAAAALRAHEQAAAAGPELGPGGRQYVELIGRVLVDAGAMLEKEEAATEPDAPRIIVP
jgi:hypothetical protein